MFLSHNPSTAFKLYRKNLEQTFDISKHIQLSASSTYTFLTDVSNDATVESLLSRAKSKFFRDSLGINSISSSGKCNQIKMMVKD